MKQALIVSSDFSYSPISDLPYILKKGGFQITAISPNHWSLTHNSFVDRWIKAEQSPQAVIEQTVQFLQSSKTSYDMIILGSDQLIWSIYDSKIDQSIKARIYPILNPEYYPALDGKIEVSVLCKKIGIPTPQSEVAYKREEAKNAAEKLGFPILLKINRSSGGKGVKLCNQTEEIERAYVSKWPILVEKFIPGDSISVEPIYLKSRLIGYNYSIMTHSAETFGPSLERIFKPCGAIEPILKTIGDKLQMHGIANMSFILEKSTQKHYLIELDFRPNRWIRYGEFVGVDWASAFNLEKPHQIESPKREKMIRHFPSDLFNAIESKSWSRILYWALNLNGCWKCFPYYDRRILLTGACRFVKRMLRAILEFL